MDVEIVHGDTWIVLIVFFPGLRNIVSFFPLCDEKEKYIPWDGKKISTKTNQLNRFPTYLVE